MSDRKEMKPKLVMIDAPLPIDELELMNSTTFAVIGNGKDLDISPVYDNLDIAKPEDESNTKKNVIIPEEKK